jgi:hypothetical protein
MDKPKFKLSINLGTVAAHILLATLGYKFTKEVGTSEAYLAYTFAWVWLLTRKA